MSICGDSQKQRRSGRGGRGRKWRVKEWNGAVFSGGSRPPPQAQVPAKRGGESGVDTGKKKMVKLSSSSPAPAGVHPPPGAYTSHIRGANEWLLPGTLV